MSSVDTADLVTTASPVLTGRLMVRPEHVTSAGQATCAPTADPTAKPTRRPCPTRPPATQTATERVTRETTSGRVQEKVHPQVPPRCSRPLSNRLARKARPPSHHQKKNNDWEGGRVFRAERKGEGKSGAGPEREESRELKSFLRICIQSTMRGIERGKE